MRVGLVRMAFLAVLAVAGTAAAGSKSQLFDLDRDLALFFRAQAELLATEAAQDDTLAQLEKKKAERLQLFKKYGIRDEAHWARERRAGMEYYFSKRALKVYGGQENVDDMRRASSDGLTLEQYRAKRGEQEASRQAILEQMKLHHDPAAFDQALLAPIEGVTLAQYAAAANAALFHDDDWAAVAKETGITEKRFERLSELWTERMRKDPTQLLALKYAGHLMAAARGRYAAAAKDLGEAYLNGTPLRGPEPVSLETWVEITQYYGSKSAEIKGTADITRILQPYSLTFYEWNIVSNWWGRKRTEAMERDDRQFLAAWMGLMDRYRRKFAPAPR
jgi:hypothetical protein